MRTVFGLLLSVTCACLAGCSSRSDMPKLAAADGEVKFQGAPLANATVMFIPTKGPLAVGVTDMNGKFSLSTGAMKGVVVGDVKATVTAMKQESPTSAVAKQPTTPEESAAYMKAAAELQAKASAMAESPEMAAKSTIPDKYSKVDSSGLSFTIKPDGDNHFKIDLAP